MNKTDTLDEIQSLVAQRGSNAVTLGRALALCDALGATSRLLVGIETRSGERWVEIAGGTPDLTIGIRRSDRSMCWLGEPTRVSDETLAWALIERDARPVLWLEISDARHSVRVRLADAGLALISAHGWRDGVEDSVAEPVLWVADLLEGVAQVLTDMSPTPNSENRYPLDRQLRSRRALDLMRPILSAPS